MSDLASRFDSFFAQLARFEGPLGTILSSSFSDHLAGLGANAFPAVLRPEWEEVLYRFLGLRDDARPSAADAERLSRLQQGELNALIDLLNKIRQELNWRRSMTNISSSC